MTSRKRRNNAFSFPPSLERRADIRDCLISSRERGVGPQAPGIIICSGVAAAKPRLHPTKFRVSSWIVTNTLPAL